MMSTPEASVGVKSAGGSARPRQLPGSGCFCPEYLVLLLTIVYFLVMWPIVPEIATVDTLLDILAAMMPLLVVAIGQTFVLIVAGIDLSAPSIIAMASVVGASVMTGDGGYRRRHRASRSRSASSPSSPSAAPIGTFNGAVHDAVQHALLHRHADDDDVLLRRGDLVHRDPHRRELSIGNLPPRLHRHRPGADRRRAVSRSPSRSSSRVVAHVVLSRTVYGRWLYAVGLNPRAAAVSGVPVRRVVFWAFVISGLLRGDRLDPLHRRGSRPARRSSASASCSTSSARR